MPVDWENSTAECVPFVAGDFKSATVGDGTTSVCDDITLPAGTTEFDDADLLPRSMIVLPGRSSTSASAMTGKPFKARFGFNASGQRGEQFNDPRKLSDPLGEQDVVNRRYFWNHANYLKLAARIGNSRTR
jgi:hypothetical protein